MTNIELYINQKLCDIQNPENLGVRLNRVLINPAELSSKDAQYSYSVTIPSTPINDSIFSYVNVEEVKNKFNTYHSAQLYVDGVLIFDGRFKISEIDSEGNYKGNLVLPAKKTIKEIFGEKKMNEAGKWELNLKEIIGENGNEELNFIEFISTMNQRSNPQCIFPLVLYGLLPKQPKVQNEKGNLEYSDKKLWDETVRLGIADFPPSINCLQAIKQIFSTLKDNDDKQITITGSAFEDPQLTNLYMSYQNPTDYEQPWNWGQFGRMRLTGVWTNINNDGNDVIPNSLETRFHQTTGDFEQVAVDLFNSKNAEITIEKDAGNNILQLDVLDGNKNKIRTTTTVVIPASGLYKLTFKVNIGIINGSNSGSSNKDLGIRFAYPNSHKTYNLFDNIRHEVKVLRTRDEGTFNIDNCTIDGVYFKNNQNQDIENDWDAKLDASYKFQKHPMYFPNVDDNSVLFVDPAKNAQFVCGFRWGKNDSKFRHNPLCDGIKGIYSVLAAKHGFSWDNNVDKFNYCAINAPIGYQKFGTIDTEVSEEEEEEADAEDRNVVMETGYSQTDKYKINVQNPFLNFAKRINRPAGVHKIFNNVAKKKNTDEEAFGQGEVSVIIWLDKGEKLTVADVADKGVFRDSGKSKTAYIKHAVTFELDIEPFRTNKDWFKIGFDGTGTEVASKDWMDWTGGSEEGLFPDSTIDLVKFLPSEVKVDEWLDNFCKAFNLQLSQDDEGKFQLNTKPISPVSINESVIDLDGKASLAKANNQPLGLPSEYQLGFKINKDEEGYVKSELLGKYEDGGGSLKTGNLDGQVITQNSNFSYNWYKSITKGEDLKNPKPSDITMEVPVITNKEIWDESRGSGDYAEMQQKLYTNLAQRFWYSSGDAINVGEIWKKVDNNKKTELYLPRLSNSLGLANSFSLNYHDKPNSILTSYFNIIATDDSNFTFVECYLTPDEYDQMDGTKLVKLNSDLYYLAAVEGYDPLGQNKTKLKLIRKV